MIWNPAVECLPRLELEALQLARLRELIPRARAAVPLYGERLPEALPGSLAELARLPWTEKRDLQEAWPLGLLAVPRAELLRIHGSTGTRGRPTLVGYTREDLDVWREVMARVLVAAGARPGDLLQIAYGYGLFTGGLGFHDGAERVGLTVVPTAAGQSRRQALLLRELRPVGLAATPSFALHVAEVLAADGAGPGDLGLRYGLFGAEPWSEELRRVLERALGCRAHDVYGLSEIIGPGVAGECMAREGLHIAEDHFLAEVVDPATGEPLPAGATGELVLTTLTKRAMPLLRYRTGDVTALDPRPCRCGRTLARMARIKGRTDDMLLINGVNVYPAEVEQALLGQPALGSTYQLVVDRSAALARLAVEVEAAPEAFASWGAVGLAHPGAREVAAAARTRLHQALGISADVHVLAPAALPRSEGKAVRVIDRPVPQPGDLASRRDV